MYVTSIGLTQLGTSKQGSPVQRVKVKVGEYIRRKNEKKNPVQTSSKAQSIQNTTFGTYNADLKACVTKGIWILVERRKVHPDH